MSLEAVIAFWGTSFLLVMTPGANWAYMITASIRNRSIPAAVAGLLLGYVALTAVVAAGVGALVASNPAILTVLTFTGAAYLIWLGINGFLHPAQPTVQVDTDHERPGGVNSSAGQSAAPHPVGGLALEEAVAAPISPSGRLRETLQGAGISGLNPKGLILLFGLLPDFVEPHAMWPIALQIVILGLVHTATCGVVYIAVGYGARAVLSSRPSLARGASRFSAIAMSTIGALLVIHQVVRPW